MSVRRDVEIPATERVEFIRMGQIASIERGATAEHDVIRLGNDPLGGPDLSWYRGGKAIVRVMVSSDRAGDEMRAGIATLSGGTNENLLGRKGAVPSTWTTRDWLWVAP